MLRVVPVDLWRSFASTMRERELFFLTRVSLVLLRVSLGLQGDVVGGALAAVAVELASASVCWANDHAWPRDAQEQVSERDVCVCVFVGVPTAHTCC